MEAPDSLRGELAASIEGTLVREARRNELTIAGVRFFIAIGMGLVELWIAIGGSKLGDMAWVGLGLTVLFAVWGAGLLALLRRGWWSPAVPWIAPAFDAAYLAGREAVVLYSVDAAHVRHVQDLATIVGVAAVITLTGAFRLSRTSVVYAASLGLAVYVWLAASIGLHPFFSLLHVIVLLGTALGAVGLTRIVKRAVQAEVTRLTISRLLPAPVLAAAADDPLALLSEPRSLDATIVVTDLRGFTNWAEHRQPLEVLAFLNRVQGALAEIVLQHGGTVDKFMGDGMLAVFGAPSPLPDHPDRAIDAVREMLDTLGAVDGVRLGIGVHTGEVVVGCLGSGVRMEFTVLGDTVNTASRLESATKTEGVACLVSAETSGRLERHTLVSAGEIEIRGRDQRIEVFTLPTRGSPETPAPRA